MFIGANNGSGGGNYASAYNIQTLSNAHITLGFKPKKLICSYNFNNFRIVIVYDEEESTTSFLQWNSTAPYNLNIGASGSQLQAITNDGFTLYDAYGTNYDYIAIG